MSLRPTTALLSALTAPVNAGLWALGLRRPDPWRRTLGLGLRGEGTKFALSAFGLRSKRGESDEALARRFATWLGRDAAATQRFALRHGPHLVERTHHAQTDCALLEFQPDGTLQSFVPLSDDLAGGGDDHLLALLLSHRLTLLLPEQERPGQLAQALRDLARPGLSQRLLNCLGLSFEREFADRFAPPAFHLRRGLGGAGLEFVLRRLPDSLEFDVWMQIQHTLDDGAPRQELLTRLMREWDPAPVTFPADAGDPGVASYAPPLPCSAPGERPLQLHRDFIDLSPLQSWARAHRAPVVAALLWWLAREPECEGRRFGVAVDVPAGGGFERAVDLIGVRPADFPEFADFAAHFVRRAAEARERRGPSWRAMRNAAFLPASLAGEWMANKQDLAEATFGTMGVTMLRDASVFVAPMADFGWPDGFLALGNTALPAPGGGRVTSVTLKAEQVAARERLAAVRRAPQNCRHSSH